MHVVRIMVALSALLRASPIGNLGPSRQTRGGHEDKGLLTRRQTNCRAREFRGSGKYRVSILLQSVINRSSGLHTCNLPTVIILTLMHEHISGALFASSATGNTLPRLSSTNAPSIDLSSR